MQNPYTYVRRTFLNEDDLVHASYVLATVEDSYKGECLSSGKLHIADCTRVIKLEFYLGRPEARTASIAKINLLLEVLGAFRDALINEAFLIAKHEKRLKRKERKNGSHTG